MILPLNLVGVILGRNILGQPDNPCRVNTVPRPIPEKKWYALLTNEQLLASYYNCSYTTLFQTSLVRYYHMLCNVQPILIFTIFNVRMHSICPCFNVLGERLVIKLSCKKYHAKQEHCSSFTCSLSYFVCRFMEPWAIVLLGGLLPFGSIFIEVYAW